MSISISETLKNWYETKQQINKLQKEQDRYKEIINNYMAHKDTNIIKTKYFSVNKRNNTRESVSKKDIPPDLWRRVCNRSTYHSLILKRL